MIGVLPPMGKYKCDAWRILLVKCYIDNSVRLRICIRNVNRRLVWTTMVPWSVPPTASTCEHDGTAIAEAATSIAGDCPTVASEDDVVCRTGGTLVEHPQNYLQKVLAWPSSSSSPPHPNRLGWYPLGQWLNLLGHCRSGHGIGPSDPEVEHPTLSKRTLPSSHWCQCGEHHNAPSCWICCRIHWHCGIPIAAPRIPTVCGTWVQAKYGDHGM
jgi:hypothetical protein